MYVYKKHKHYISVSVPEVPAAVVDEAEAVAAGASQGFPVSMATATDDVDDDVAHAAMTNLSRYYFDR